MISGKEFRITSLAVASAGLLDVYRSQKATGKKAKKHAFWATTAFVLSPALFVAGFIADNREGRA